VGSHFPSMTCPYLSQQDSKNGTNGYLVERVIKKSAKKPLLSHI
jgi:hypothetical protein